MLHASSRRRSAPMGWILTAFAVGLFFLAFAGLFLWMTLPSNAGSVVRASWYERGKVTASGEAFRALGLSLKAGVARVRVEPIN